MADLSITAANTLKGAGSQISNQTAGETLTQGIPVYQKASDQKLYKAQCDGTVEQATVFGITLNSAFAGQPIQVITAGPLTLGATMVVGLDYVVSAAAGLVCPRADLVTGNTITKLGYASSATVLQVDIQSTGVAVP